MVTKGVRQLLMEANDAADTIEVPEALELVGQEDVVFVDVRESHERAQGFVPGSIHAPRGFLEFIADPEGPMHNPAFTSGQAADPLLRLRHAISPGRQDPLRYGP